MQNQKAIQELGFSPKEAKVYLATLALGEAHVSDIAKKTNLPLSTVQAVVERLSEAGLMHFYVMRRYKYWVAEKPEHLLEEVRRREKLVKAAMPKLTEIRDKGQKRRKIKKSVVSELGPIRFVADEISQPVLVANENANIEYVNTAWEKQFGYKRYEVKGKNPRMLKSGLTSFRVYEEMWSLLNRKKMFQSKEMVDKKKSGATFTVHTTIFPLVHAGRTFYIQILEDGKYIRPNYLYDNLIAAMDTLQK